LREVSPGSQRLFIPVNNEPKRRNYPSDTLPALLPDMMNALLLNRLKKQQQRAWEVSRKQLLGAFSVGGIHHLRRPGAKAL